MASPRISALQRAELAARAVRRWLERVGVETRFIEPGSPWENGYVESFNGNGKLRDDCLNRERFNTLLEAQIWRLWRTTSASPTPPSA